MQHMQAAPYHAQHATRQGEGGGRAGGGELTVTMMFEALLRTVACSEGTSCRLLIYSVSITPLHCDSSNTRDSRALRRSHRTVAGSRQAHRKQAGVQCQAGQQAPQPWLLAKQAPQLATACGQGAEAAGEAAESVVVYERRVVGWLGPLIWDGLLPLVVHDTYPVCQQDPRGRVL